ncbi:hypothetical protein K438DRAFT_1982356 [Mycena galopus ATCC 62051]|nr:hypothetical protein K438DRAFT_1982356 [Mycena galopus ATCC 62051]
MSSSALLLSDLPPDIIFGVFACCNISSIVSTGQTCQYLCHLAFDRSVWLNLLDNLRQRSILDRTSANLKNLSVEQMIGVVRRLPTIRTGGGILDWENLAKLLPSGRYVLFKNWDELKCWNVADDRLIWKHTSVLQDASVLEFAAEEMYAEDSLIVMICLRVMDEPRKNYVEMISLDVQTGTPNQLWIARAPDSDYGDPFRSTVISGALAVGRTSFFGVVQFIFGAPL